MVAWDDKNKLWTAPCPVDNCTKNGVSLREQEQANRDLEDHLKEDH